jgi:hypothetical protein
MCLKSFLCLNRLCLNSLLKLLLPARLNIQSIARIRAGCKRGKKFNFIFPLNQLQNFIIFGL